MCPFILMHLSYLLDPSGKYRFNVFQSSLDLSFNLSRTIVTVEKREMEIKAFIFTIVYFQCKSETCENQTNVMCDMISKCTGMC